MTNGTLPLRCQTRREDIMLQLEPVEGRVDYAETLTRHGRSWVVYCFIGATFEHTWAPGAYVPAIVEAVTGNSRGRIEVR